MIDGMPLSQSFKDELLASLAASDFGFKTYDPPDFAPDITALLHQLSTDKAEFNPSMFNLYALNTDKTFNFDPAGLVTDPYGPDSGNTITTNPYDPVPDISSIYDHIDDLKNQPLPNLYDLDTDFPSNREQSDFKPASQQAENIKGQIQEINEYILSLNPYRSFSYYRRFP